MDCPAVAVHPQVCRALLQSLRSARPTLAPVPPADLSWISSLSTPCIGKESFSLTLQLRVGESLPIANLVAR